MHLGVDGDELNAPRHSARYPSDARLQRSFAWLTVVGLLLSAGCIQDRFVRNGKLDTRSLARIQASTSKLRRLPIRKPIPSAALSRRSAGKVIAAINKANASALATEQTLHHRLGLLPPRLGRAEVDQKFVDGPVAGFYDPMTKKLYVITDYPLVVRLQMDLIGMFNGIDFGHDMILSHEITHALQDQHFDLAHVDAASAHNADQALAMLSLIESDANVLGFAHSHAIDMRGTLRTAMLIGYARMNYAMSEPFLPLLAPGVPSFHRKLAYGHYTRGLSIVQRALGSGGWDTLTRLYREAPPASTEQVMFPRKYFGPHCDPPVELPMAATPDVLKGYRRLLENTFGALQWKLLIEHHGAWRWTGTRHASSWGGDRYDLWWRDGQTVLVWRQVWDTEEAARDAMALWIEQLEERYEQVRERPSNPNKPPGLIRRFDITPSPTKPSRSKVLVRRPEVVHVERRGRRVLIVEGASPKETPIVVRSGWQALLPESVTRTSARCPAKVLVRPIQRTEAPPLTAGERIFLPHRTMHASASGLWSSTRPTSVVPFYRAGIRWGVRDGVVLDAALLSLSVRTTPSPFLTAVTWRPGLSTLDIGLTFALVPSDSFAIIAEARSLRLWGDAVDVIDPDLIAAGIVFSPHPRLVLAASLRWALPVAQADGSRGPRRLAFGSPLGLSGNGLPLVEWRVHDMLWVHWDPLYVPEEDAGDGYKARIHRVGLSLYF